MIMVRFRFVSRDGCTIKSVFSLETFMYPFTKVVSVLLVSLWTLSFAFCLLSLLSGECFVTGHLIYLMHIGINIVPPRIDVTILLSSL